MQFNKENRTFYISDHIDASSVGSVCFELVNLLIEDEKKEKKEKNFNREPIVMYIQSFGGSLYDMWALVDIMIKSKTPIYTICTGYAMSAGLKIFLAGHKRFMSKHASLMYHQLSSWNVGTYQDIKEEQMNLDLMQKQIEEYVMSRTNISKSKLDVIREKKIDWFIRCDEAMKLGIIHGVI